MQLLAGVPSRLGRASEDQEDEHSKGLTEKVLLLLLRRFVPVSFLLVTVRLVALVVVKTAKMC